VVLNLKGHFYGHLLNQLLYCYTSICILVDLREAPHNFDHHNLAHLWSFATAADCVDAALQITMRVVKSKRADRDSRG